MIILDILSSLLGSKISSGSSLTQGLVSQKTKIDGSIDHRGHSGNDRTPAQKAGDKAKTKDE